MNFKFYLLLILFSISYISLYAESIVYTTWDRATKHSSYNLAEDDLTTTNTAWSNWNNIRSTTAVSTGKWYWEISLPSHGWIGVGDASLANSVYIGYNDSSWGVYASYGCKYHNGVSESFPSGGANAIVSVALDLDNGKLWVAYNGIWQGGAPGETSAVYTSVSGTLYAMANHGAGTMVANFGQSNFAYSVPTGFHAGLGEIIATPEPSIIIYFLVFACMMCTITKKNK